MIDYNLLENKDPFGNPIPSNSSNLFSAEDYKAWTMHSEFNHKNHSLPNFEGVDCFFLLTFLTYKMSSDFPMIEHDFIKHCGDKLSEFNMVGHYGINSFEMN